MSRNVNGFLGEIQTLPALIEYLRDDLEWPIEAEDIDDMFFEYDAEELGIDPAHAVGIREIKQLRPLEGDQPWGIFWISFEKKRLPVVMLRRILANLVVKKRASSSKATQRHWHLNDLLFISAYGEEQGRGVTFAHFYHDEERPDQLPVLKVLGWDGKDTVLHLADAHKTLVERLQWPDGGHDIEAWRKRWASAFTLRHKEVLSTTQELVEELAKLAHSIRERTSTIIARESAQGPLRRLFSAFRAALLSMILPKKPSPM